MENEFISVRTPGATHRLVLLHGWGADGDDLIPIGKELIKGLSEIKMELIALRAPQNHPEGFGRQWYGLFPPDWDAVPASIEQLTARIKAFSTSSIPLENTFLLGFSQGGAMALDAGCEMKLAGLICCSSYPHPKWIAPQVSPPVLLLHGEQDQVVPIEASRKVFNCLKLNKIDAELVVFEGGHEIPQNLLLKLQLTIMKWIVKGE
tara:strand:- start:2289 stop:2906 length:618 start_codon:yes stop_codon:yes gene_type:complete